MHTRAARQWGWVRWLAGRRTLVVRADKEGTPVSLEVWGHHGVDRELQVPVGLHGPVLNDGWFSTGAAWDPTEQRVAYVAEVRGPLPPRRTLCIFYHPILKNQQ